MDQDGLNELEAAMLKKWLKFLRAQGATGKPTYRFGDDFLTMTPIFVSLISHPTSIRQVHSV